MSNRVMSHEHALSALLFSCLVVPSIAEAQTFSDATFNDTDWSHSIILDQPGGSTFSSGHVAGGGNPGPYQGGSYSFTAGGGLLLGHVFEAGGSYDPSLQGAITSVEMESDMVLFTATGGGGNIGDRILVKQGGDFFSGAFATSTLGGGWEHHAIVATESDFELVTPSGLDPGTHPDFGPSGAPLEVGWITSNAGGAANTRSWGYDNWSITINTAPQVPALNPIALRALAALLLGCGGLALSGRSRRRSSPVSR